MYSSPYIIGNDDEIYYTEIEYLYETL